MKYLKPIVVLGLWIAIQGAASGNCAQQTGNDGRKVIIGAVQAGGSGREAGSGRPCALAHSVLGQLGLLAPQITLLPGADAFGAANGNLKLVVACGASPDTTYTYSRILARSGISLQAFRGDEAPESVIQLLSNQLGFVYHLANPDAPAGAPQTYVFPALRSGGKELSLAVDAANFGAAPSNRSPQGKTGGLREFYLLAKANDPELGRTQARVAAGQADTDVVRAGFHPRLDAGFGISQIDQTVLNYPPTTTHSSVFGFNYDITARVPLLHLPTFHYLASAQAAMRVEEEGDVAARQNLIARLADAYFSILKNRTDEQIAREELSRLKQVLEQARAFLKAGTGDIISVYEAQARLDAVVADLSRAESSLRLAEQKFSSIVGQPVSAVSDYLHLQPTEPVPDDVDWWLATMEKRDPQVRQAREGLTQYQEQTKAVKAERLPVLDATAGYDVSRGSAFLPDVETRQWHVGATLTVSLYSGGEATARIKRAAANQDERRYLLESTLEQRRENLKQSFFNLRYNVSLIKALRQKAVSAEIQLNAVKKGRSLGTRTAIDLLNAEQAYSMANRDLRNALYDNVVRNIQLKAAAGILDETDLSDT